MPAGVNYALFLVFIYYLYQFYVRLRFIRPAPSARYANDISEYGLKNGDMGTVVLVHQGGKEYEVEFVTLDGETVAIVSLFAAQVVRVGGKVTFPVSPSEPCVKVSLHTAPQ
jgi:hypothetical protein